jgi:5-formyltetrahydrofolate cyclo-ligase
VVVIPYKFRNRDELRKWLWKYLSDYHLTMVPRPCFARIPSFKATEVATARLVNLAEWREADTVLISPDEVTEDARVEAIRAGKTLLVPIPGEETCYRLKGVDPKQARPAALMKEIGRFADTVPLAEAAGTPLVVTGAVSVDRYGRWLGQGDVFGELAPALTRTDGLLPDAFRVALVDDMQVFEDFGYLTGELDARMDRIVTKTRDFAPEAPPPAAPDDRPPDPETIPLI